MVRTAGLSIQRPHRGRNDVLGRRTFELIQGSAPPWGPKMRVYVFSRTLRPEAYPGVKVIAAKAGKVVSALRAEPGKGDIWLFGGGQLFSSLLASGQVDAVEVTIVPVPLGGGVPLAAPGFGREPPPRGAERTE